MITSFMRKVGLIVLWCICIGTLTGCRTKPAGEEANTAMTPNQKALMATHKDKQEDK